MCFTETHTNGNSFQTIKVYHPDWKRVHHSSAEHDLSICYNTNKIVMEKEYSESLSIELLPLLMNIDYEIVWVILVYRPPGGQRDLFIYQLLQELSMLEETQLCRTGQCSSIWIRCSKKMSMHFSNYVNISNSISVSNIQLTSLEVSWIWYLIKKGQRLLSGCHQLSATTLLL